ncbi:hypothetical protein TNCV_3974981 [Trichonephila clavipes]|nr:hypothetical protein TNCV_3974981 [Trichonephila clavipes]
MNQLRPKSLSTPRRVERKCLQKGVQSVWACFSERHRGPFAFCAYHHQQLHHSPIGDDILLFEDLQRDPRAHETHPRDVQHRPGELGGAAEEGGHHPLPGARLFPALLDTLPAVLEHRSSHQRQEQSATDIQPSENIRDKQQRPNVLKPGFRFPLGSATFRFHRNAPHGGLSTVTDTLRLRRGR